MNIIHNIKSIKSDIPNNVTLVAVSKTQTNENILKAYRAGQRIFGENKVQEIERKKKNFHLIFSGI